MSLLDCDVAEIVSAALLGLASFAISLSFLMFYRVCDTLGPFMVLIRQTIAGGLMMWAFVVVLFVVATAQAMHIILNDAQSFLYAYQLLFGDTTTDFGETKQ